MNKKKRIFAILISFVIFLSCGGLVVFIKNEINQNKKIIELQNDIIILKEELKEQNNIARVEYSDEAFNYLAIGNSITKHGLTDYWWNEIGMAASSQEKDYVHLILTYLENIHEEVCMNLVNYSLWEM